jgi:photosystem II stability/assembly factor-like uncharacterized protein
MASRKGTKATKKAVKKAARKVVARVKSLKPKLQRRAKGGPPPDDPILRHKKLSADRLIGAPDASLAERRLTALARRRAMPVPAAPPVGGASNWVQLGPMAIPNGQTYSASRVLVTGRVTGIAIDPGSPSTMFIGTAKGGVWKTTNSGGSWSPMSDQVVSLSIGALTLDPTNAQVVYAGTGEGNMYYLQSFINQVQDSYYGAGLLKSIDGGTTWARVGIPEFTGAAFFRIAIHPTAANTVWVATSAGLFRSTNGGTSWTQLTNGLPVVNPATTSGCTDVALHPTNPSIAFVGFWGSGVYTTTNATAGNPTWTAVGGGLPSVTNRVSVAISPSAPLRMMATMNGAAFYSLNGGVNWANTGVTLTGCGIDDYSSNIAIDPTTPDAVYISGYPALFKLTRSGSVWSGANTAATIHPDHHSFAFDPTNHLAVYAGCDGGIFKSTDGGVTWTDTINRGFCITQFEFLDQHPTSDAVVFSGTQDNGTEQFRNSPVFHHADDGDGGFVAVDFSDPRNVIHEYYNVSPVRSTQGGTFGTFTQSIAAGITGSSLFYPPFALCSANSSWIAFGAMKLFIDDNQGLNGWPLSKQVTLPGATGPISAINFVDLSLIYCATDMGQVYAVRSTNGGATWTASVIHAAPFPARFVWDIATVPGTPSTIVVAVSGFGTGHVWQGVVPSTGVAAWTNISGTGVTGIPDIPCNAVVIDPLATSTYYAGTDVGIFRSTDSGAHWSDFGQGLPNSAVYDVRLHSAARLLRLVTHGRGMWERKLDTASMSDVNLFVRDHLMDSGRGATPEGVPAAFSDPLQHVSLGDPLYHWMCADIKVDALLGAGPSYQYPMVSSVDFVVYEAKLDHRDAERGNVNRVYVQVHNRGINDANNVTVKLLYADASAGLPPLPGDFWTAFPGNSANTTIWHPIGAAQVVTVTPTLPTVLEWDWTTPMGQATHSCLLVVIDSPSDPIPAVNKIFNVDTLVATEKHVGLKNLHIIDAPPVPPGGPLNGSAVINFHGSPKTKHTIDFVRRGSAKASLAFLLPKGVMPKLTAKASLPVGQSEIVRTTVSTRVLAQLRKQLGRSLELFDTTQLYTVKPGRGGMARLSEVVLPKEGLHMAVVLAAPYDPAQPAKWNVLHREGDTLIGGSTFVLRPRPEK